MVVLAAIVAPAGHSAGPDPAVAPRAAQAPTGREEGRQRHLFGTDQLGRDVLSRVIYGSRVSLVIGFSAVVVGGAIGGLLGLISGFAGGVVDEIIMTLADAQLAFPFILLAIGIIAVLGPSFRNLIVIVGLSGG